MGWRASYETLCEQIDELRDDSGANDAQIAQAVQSLLQGKSVPDPFRQEDDWRATLYRLGWWMFVRAPALDLRQFVYSSMALDVIQSGERTLDQVLDDIVELEEEFEPSKPAPPPIEVDEDVRAVQKVFENSAADIDRIHGMEVDELQPLITDSVAKLLEHEEMFRDLARTIAEDMMGGFQDLAEEGDELTDVVEGDAADEEEDDDEGVGHHRDEYEELDSAEAYVERGDERYEDGEVDGAVDDYTAALDFEPDNPDIYRKRGVARAAMNNTEGAIEDWTETLDRDPENVSALVDRALAHYEEDNYQEAVRDYDRAAEIEERAEIFANRATARFAIGDSDGAMEDLDRALDLDDESVAAYLNRGMVRRATGDTQGALKDFKRAIDLDDEAAEAYANLGFMRLQHGEHEAAIEKFTEAIELQPYNPEHYYNRGNAYAQEEEFEQAIEDYDEAVELDPEDADAYSNRGSARVQLQDFQGAIDDWNKAIDLDPHNPMPYVKRAAVWNLLDEEDEALEDLTRAMELAPEDWPHKQRIRLMMQNIRGTGE